ncbi:DUF6262 family protein [Streptomyces werraensis]|uniref:DUF6262 family protein n=1 Tax=Streptomyces werraensis TaxID=68284 RepID=UPI0036FD9DCA
MSAKPSRTPAEVLKAARQRDGADKRGRVLKAVQDMLRDNRRITFATVAREAGVSSWLVYAPGLRERIDQARARQAAQGHQEQQSGQKASTASEHTDLLLARQEIKRQPTAVHCGTTSDRANHRASAASHRARRRPRRSPDHGPRTASCGNRLAFISVSRSNSSATTTWSSASTSSPRKPPPHDP